MLRRITHELRHHAPLTLLGTVAGIAALVGMVYGGVAAETSELLFAIAHPAHVLLSAIASAAMYQRYSKGGWLAAVGVGCAVAVGIGTLSDSLIPFLGELIFAAGDSHVTPRVNLGFIELWWLVLPAALVGAVIGRASCHTELPHAGHVMLSAAASLFHLTMAMSAGVSAWTMAGVSAFLFLAVWLPCCTSDIILPLLLVPKHRWLPCHHCKDAPEDVADDST